ncbi:MAG: cytochrome C oxidase subunit IV family protein [Deltaproteobacteria bacterium]|nr:cytochrome C oxidase subunit IV family protein [Deltaproteobacteria bacterium]
MTTAHREPPNYIGVFWRLLFLTIAEIVVIFLPIPRIVIGIVLVGLALSKAALVALFYMHLKFERQTLTMIALTPLLLCVLFLFALLPDLSATPHRSVGASPPAAAPR